MYVIHDDKINIRHCEMYLSNCGYKEKLNYRDPIPPNLITKRKQQRNILRFNLPYSETVKQNC